MPPNVNTSATTNLMRTSQSVCGDQVMVYENVDADQVSYTIEPHPPTPRDDKR